MNRLYKTTFDQIRMPEDRARSLRAELASRCSDRETEVISMNKHSFLRRPAAFLVAVALIAALSITALACGGYVVYEVVSGDAAPENSFSVDLTEQDADFEFGAYDYTEEDGQIVVSFDVGNQD